LAAFLPGRPTFVIDTEVADWWWVAPFLRFVDVLRVDPTSPISVRAMLHQVEEGRVVVIFPEGRITVTGIVMKIYNGSGMILDRTGRPVVPVHIAGAERTPFSYLKGKIRRTPFPRITLTSGAPRILGGLDGVRGRSRRQAASRWLYDVMVDNAAAAFDTDRTLPEALWEALARHGGGRPILEDMDRAPLSLRKIVIAAMVLGRHLERRTAPGEIVGLMLPNAVGTVITVLALQMIGRVPALLNYTAGKAAVESACRTAAIRTVLTAERFVTAARLERLRDHLAESFDLVDLQALRHSVSIWDRAWGAIRFFTGRRPTGRGPDGADGPAVVLFTSGSEGVPKGVVLSHRNLLANCHQVAGVVDVGATDTVFAPLPLFHAFGLLGGLVLPLLWGVPVILYPNALHYRRIPDQLYIAQATILFGTDTFLAGYGRSAHPLDFRSLRYVFAGGERVRDETRRLWAETFGIRLLEGYGVTEAAPVVAVNTPTHNRSGTAGRMVAGMRWQLEPVPGISEGGRLRVAGPNVMLGYLRADRPGAVVAPPGGWHDTGDLVRIDDDGYVTIVGRIRRFAKIAGEMISLGAVEDAVADHWPGWLHAVLAVADARKGERLVLVTTCPDVTRTDLAAALSVRGLSDLARPQLVVTRDTLPQLATGKVDYVALARDICTLS
jgi:acyl-[acyl-carrier-protein]-phospholipid O-acyltransferase/long-chain-fatty-acid--[acyl-carrier-protein] ligase